MIRFTGAGSGAPGIIAAREAEASLKAGDRKGTER